MDIQQRLIDLANEKSRLTSEDKILLDAMKTLGEFVIEIDNGVDKENFDSKDFSATANNTNVSLIIGDKTLNFLRNESSIDVLASDGSSRFADVLSIKDQKVISKKYDTELSNELFAKYSEVFF